MNFLLDTPVMSETRKVRPNPGVLGWLSEQRRDNLFLSVLSIGEYRKGVHRLKDEPYKRRLSDWLAALQEEFAGRILPVTLNVADRWGRMLAERELVGGILAPVDSLIGATAAEAEMTVVTRNIRHYEDTGVPVLNPWDPDPA